MKASKTNSGSAALPPDMPPDDERSRREMMWPAGGPHAGRFQKGQSGNPQGRPPGSRNKNTLLIEEMMDEEAPNIVRTAIDMAIAGNPRMVKLCVERLMPALKERPVPLRLPKVERSQDVPAASSAVWAAVAEGVLSVIEARMHLEVLATHEKTLAEAERRARMDQVEGEEDR